MDVLKDLSVSGLDALKADFLLREPQGGLTEEEFIEVVSRVCSAHKGSTAPSDAHIRKMFAVIDVLGLGRVSWDMFSMYAVDSLRHRGHAEITWRKKDDVFRPYHLEQLVINSHTTQVTEIRLLPKIGKVMKVFKDGGGFSTLNLCEAARNLPSFGTIRHRVSPLLAWDFIPHVAGTSCSNSIVCSYSGGCVRLFNISKTNRPDCYLDEEQDMHLPDSQTSLRWISSINRLGMGGRSGAVTLWDMHEKRVTLRHRLFYKSVTAMRFRKHFLYAASLETNDAVKCLDLERNTVRYAFDDHSVGGALLLEMDEQFMFTAGFEPGIVQRTLLTPRAQPVYLYDTFLPHKGRISALHRLQDSSTLVSGDTRGNVKFWDLRMGACVQTIQGRSPNISAGGGEQLDPEENVGGYQAAPVCSICHLEMLGKLTVATSKELLVLSSDVFTRPGLVDDRQNCRFVFFPNPDFFLTVHDRSAKIWHSATGILAAFSEPDMMDFDVTACCIVEPLKRQLLLGTMGGEVKAFSVATLQQSVDLTFALREYVCGTEIMSLHTISRFRSMNVPYAFVVSQSSVFLVPIQPHCSPDSVFSFQGLLKTFMREKETIKATAITENRFLFSTSGARVHVVDYKDVVVFTHTFTMSSVVDSIIVRPAFIRTGGHSCELPKSGAFTSDIAFFGDVTGQVHIATLGRRVRDAKSSHGTASTARKKMNQLASECDIIGSWLPRQPESWAAGDAQSKSPSFGSPRRCGKTLRAAARFLREQRRRSRRRSADELSCGSDVFSLDEVTTCTVSFVFLERYNVLVTVDEEGAVRVWDVASAVAQCVNGIFAGPPVLITSWRIPEREVIFFGVSEHPTLHLPLLLTATGDLKASVWSTDGVVLGSLSSGREVDEASGGRRFGLRPYTLMSADTTPALWGKLLDHVERAASSGASRPFRLRWKQCTEALRALQQAPDEAAGQSSPSDAASISLPSLAAKVPAELPVLPLGPPPGAARRPEKSQACGAAGNEPRDGADRGVRRKKRDADSIVKPVHQRLVRRATVAFYLGRTGAVSLPPLNVATARRRTQNPQ